MALLGAEGFLEKREAPNTPLAKPRRLDEILQRQLRSVMAADDLGGLFEQTREPLPDGLEIDHS